MIPTQTEELYQYTRKQVADACRNTAPSPIEGDYPRIDIERWNQTAQRERAARLDTMSADEARVLAALPLPAKPIMAKAYARAYTWLAAQALDFWRVHAGLAAGHPRKLLALAITGDPEIQALIDAVRKAVRP